MTQLSRIHKLCYPPDIPVEWNHGGDVQTPPPHRRALAPALDSTPCASPTLDYITHSLSRRLRTRVVVDPMPLETASSVVHGVRNSGCTFSTRRPAPTGVTIEPQYDAPCTVHPNSTLRRWTTRQRQSGGAGDVLPTPYQGQTGPHRQLPLPRWPKDERV